jgi:hypothetical protein
VVRHRAQEPEVPSGRVYGHITEVDEAMAALYETAGVRVRPGGIDPRWGCAISAHEHLGWCCSCPSISMAAEIGAWRIMAAGHPAPDVAWARAVSAQAA